MTVQQLFNQREENSVSFKAVDESNTELTKDEADIVLRKALHVKIAQINSAAYARAVNSEPVYKKPAFAELHETLIAELALNYGWLIDEHNEAVIRTLCYYFSGDEDFELIEEGYSLRKGLILIGPVGCGKTTLLKVLQRNSFNPYRFISCRKVASDYAEFGASAIANYSTINEVAKRDFFGHSKVGMCFDDLGTESEKKNFGNQLNVLSEIILNRYDNSDIKNKTHFTTNLSADELKDYYGVRATSRMREMLNIVEISFDSPDRRK